MIEYGRFGLRASEVADLDPYKVRKIEAKIQAEALIIEEKPQEEVGKLEFTGEQKQQLEELGYQIYKLSGITPNEMKGICFKYNFLRKGLRDLKNEKSIEGEVAIDPNNFFWQETSYAKYLNQAAYVISNEKKSGVEGTRFIWGNLADYVELSYLYFARNPGSAFGSLFKSDWARISEPGPNLSTAVVRIKDNFVEFKFESTNKMSENIKMAPFLIRDATLD